MPDATARISVAITAQVRQGGSFPSVTTYPASVERYLSGGAITAVYAIAGTLGATPTTLPVSGTLATIKLWYIENTGASSVTVADAPVNGVVPRGQIVLATNDDAGWPAGTVTLTGAAGATFKVIALGA